jgi:MoaA/NifB/PqqE/SkfB family radical SAM enzyme
MNKIILKIWYSCNHKCDFCHAEFNKQIKANETLKTSKKIFYIKKNKKDIDTILFSWWEPTIQSNFFNLLELSSSLGFKTWVITNGSMIYKEVFLDKCLKYNFSYLYLSIHWWTEEIHNKMTQTKNSFSQIKKLLSNQNLKKIYVLINCVVTKNNISNLEEIVLFINEYWYNNIKFSLLEPKWLWLQDIDNLFVSPDIVAKEIIKLIDKYKKINISWDWLPLCLVKWYEDKVLNLQKEKIMYMSETYEDKIYNTDYWVREYWEKCIWCKKKKICYWNYYIYNKLYWEDYLKKYKW